jgi:SAM-dependent methyltransferase
MINYESWFDSKFYHILYKNRDDKEAQHFIDKLLHFLNPAKNCKIWDMACGRGRHCVYLNKKGFDVAGTDLSSSSIDFARSSENKTLSFKVHDMRETFKTDEFDIVLNLFTSFGYFENDADNLRVIRTAERALKKEGFLIIDFMNVQNTLKNLVEKETKTIEDIDFRITRKIENKFIKKEIAFSHEGKEHKYTEQVEALELKDFESYFEQAGLKLVNLFGDYNLSEFDESRSERLIMICEKP